MGARKIQPVQADGFQWAQGVISNPKSWTLIDPEGFPWAHVYPCDDHTWRAVYDDGEVIAEGFAKSGPAFAAADRAAGRVRTAIPSGTSS